MPSDGHAVLKDIDGRSALCFERVLAHPRERVWRALTRHDELSSWHPTPFKIEPLVDGAVTYGATAGSPEMHDGLVIAYEPPHLLAHAWGEDELRWELRAHGDGCLLRLTHLFDDRFKAARDGAGWHLCLDALASALDGDANPQPGGEPRLPDGWKALNSDYQQRFGISPEQATPVPGR
jgi:uncharacterized protein YndB with AHSA1/START domain